MLVVVGSTNPVKVNAAKEVFSTLFDSPRVEPSDVDSGVSDNPSTIDEAIQGARNRAFASVRGGDVDYGVGFEGGTLEIGDTMFTQAWCCVVDSVGRVGTAGGEHMELPDSVAENVKSGIELGYAVDEVVGKENVKQDSGAIGEFTGELTTRQEAYEHLLRMALARFVTSEYYD